MSAEVVFSNRLRDLRAIRGLSQQKVADGIGITKVGYQYYEYGRKMPGFGVLLRLSNFFDVSADYLLGRSDEPRLPTKRDWAMIHALEAAQATAEEKESEPKKE